MATTSTPVMSWEAFEKLPDSDGLHRELIEGELQVLPPPKSGHTKIALRALKLLLPLAERGLGQPYPEAGYKLTEKPGSWIQPDVSFLTTRRSAATDEDGYFKDAPELAVEVVSPSESAEELIRKVDLLLGKGSQAVWVVYPKKRKVHVFTPEGVTVLGEKDSLKASFLAHDWTVPVAKLFED